MVRRAARFAERAHAGQTRRYTGEPYHTHPAAVAAIVATVPHDWAMLAAAHLHDVVEDTDVRITDIVRSFGRNVADLVDWLTDVSRPEDGNRETRRRLDREHTARAPARAQTIKLADLIHNTESVARHDPSFARVYLAEKRLLLGVMDRGDRTLWRRAEEQLRRYT